MLRQLRLSPNVAKSSNLALFPYSVFGRLFRGRKLETSSDIFKRAPSLACLRGAMDIVPISAGGAWPSDILVDIFTEFPYRITEHLATPGMTCNADLSFQRKHQSTQG